MPAARRGTPGGPPSIDRRVLRTRAMLREALLRLILDKGWEAVSVLDVCQRANVGRSTFYSHFADKEELLLSGFDDLRDMLVAMPPASGPLGFVQGLLDHVGENKRLWRALVGKRSGQVVQQRFRDLVLELTRVGLSGAGVRESSVEPMSRFLSGAVTELLMWSLDHPRAPGARELWSRLEEMAAPILERAVSRPPSPIERPVVCEKAALAGERARCPFRVEGAS